MLFAFDASVRAEVTAVVTHRAPDVQAVVQQLRGDIHELTAAVSANAAQAVWLDGAKTGGLAVGAVALLVAVVAILVVLVRKK